MTLSVTELLTLSFCTDNRILRLLWNDRLADPVLSRHPNEERLVLRYVEKLRPRRLLLSYLDSPLLLEAAGAEWAGQQLYGPYLRLGARSIAVVVSRQMLGVAAAQMAASLDGPAERFTIQFFESPTQAELWLRKH